MPKSEKCPHRGRSKACPGRAVSPQTAALRAFTLFEVGIVLAMIAALSTLFLVAFTGKRGDSKLDRARADLQVIQMGLEEYRARFGDYPKVPTNWSDIVGAGEGDDSISDANAYLLNALNGQIGPTHQVIKNVPSMLNNSLLTFAKAGLPLSKLQDNQIIDPWGSPYVYDYQPSLGTWLEFGYKLYSHGPDKASGTEDDIAAQ